ncbi:MAG: hypothetical protein A2Y24_08720 [Clostridiales bacterium GWE2_32_10]|nr:MAG: hypothetical protein A2Y24_08720 [Clostridiales bacterium GWE2_32_10]HBY20931.1 flavodoxin [Clostridiales bacterium]
MKTAIIYASKHGSVERCVILLKERLLGEVDLLNIHEHSNPDIQDYSDIIIGGSIYMGKIQKEIIEFCNKNLDILTNTNVGLFISSALMDADEFKKNFPAKLLETCRVQENFGYELYIHDFSFIEKITLKFIPKEYLNNYGIKINKIEKFINDMNINKTR